MKIAEFGKKVFLGFNRFKSMDKSEDLSKNFLKKGREEGMCIKLLEIIQLFII